MNSRPGTNTAAWAILRIAVVLFCAIPIWMVMPRDIAAQTSQTDQSNQADQNSLGIPREEPGDPVKPEQIVIEGDFISSDQAEAEPEREPADAPPEVRLRLSSTKLIYFIGEVIQLDLAFRAQTPNRFSIDASRTARDGQFNFERFEVAPNEGIRDPLQAYFEESRIFFFEGSPTRPFLSTTATHLGETLNEWIEFSEPGTYRIRVASTRVGDNGGGDTAGERLKVTSNWIELKIEAPDAAWQKETLARSLEEIGQNPPGPDGQPNEQRARALEQLRFLDTKEATRELARRLRGENVEDDRQYVLGLVGSPERDTAREEMHRLIREPDFPVMQEFLGALAELSNGGENSIQIAGFQVHGEVIPQDDGLLDALPQKRGKAAAVSLATALSLDGNASIDGLPEEFLKQVMAGFSSLDPTDQLNLLQTYWPRVKGPAWLPLVRAIALGSQRKPNSTGRNIFDEQSTAAAFEDWYELDPDGARAAVIREISRPVPRFDGNQLGFLADERLPEAEEAIAKNFVAARDDATDMQLASLLFRYADENVESEVLDKVVERVEAGDWACMAQEKMLAYLLRVDPQEAAPLIREAMQPHEGVESACRNSLLMDIASDHNDAAMEPVALEALHDAEEMVVENAAQYLGAYGLADAEKPLWDRYREWSADWKDRVKDLTEQDENGQQPNAGSLRLGQVLAEAISGGLGWLSDPAKLQHGKELALVPQISQPFDRALYAWRANPLRIQCAPSAMTGGCDEILVAQYELATTEALQTKLGEFPRGTRFNWSVWGPATQQGTDGVFREIVEFAKKRGIEVTREEPQTTAMRTAAPGLK
jgi:hypothetical protein